MTNVVITRSDSIGDTEAAQKALEFGGEALALHYIEGPLEEAINDIVLGQEQIVIEFLDEKVKDIDGLLKMQKEKVFSATEVEEKAFSIRTIAERMKTMNLPLIKQMRLLIRDNKMYYKMSLRKMKQEPERFVQLKTLFTTDFMQHFTEVLPAVMEGDTKLAQSLGLQVLAPKAIKASRLLQRDFLMMQKVGGAPKQLLRRAQNNFSAFIDAITDVVFPKWRETFAGLIDTDEVELDETIDEDEEVGGEEKQFSEKKQFANEQRGEEAAGEFMELTPAEEKILRRESKVEGDGEAVFSEEGSYEDRMQNTADLFDTIKNADSNDKYVVKNRTNIEAAIKDGYDKYIMFDTHDDEFKAEHELSEQYDFKTASITDLELGKADNILDGKVHEIIMLKPKDTAPEMEGAPMEGKEEGFSKKTCSSLIKKSRKQFGVTQNQRVQMDKTQEELESHPELPGSMGVHTDKNELEELNPLKKEKVDTGKDVSAKNGEDHGHGITPKGEKTFAFEGMPMETNEYKSVDSHTQPRFKKAKKSCSSLISGKRRAFREGFA